MSKGINVYEDARRYFGRANESVMLENFSGDEDPCIFLSHRRCDKAAVKKIGDYIQNAGINIYLDANDVALQQADREGDHHKITAFLERGIRCSTDVMACISDRTKGSWWVPYEFGFGKNCGKQLSCLMLKDVTVLPSYLNIVDLIGGVDDLNEYLRQVKDRQLGSNQLLEVHNWPDYLRKITSSSETLMNFSIGHPLQDYLNR